MTNVGQCPPKLSSVSGQVTVKFLVLHNILFVSRISFKIGNKNLDPGRPMNGGDKERREFLQFRRKISEQNKST